MNHLSKFFVVLFISLIGLVEMSFFMKQDLNDDLSQEDKMLYAFVAKAGDTIGKKYQMSRFSIGGGIENGIWLMSLDFQRYGSRLNEQKARQLIIKCLNDFLELVNNDLELRPYLKVYPFKAQNIDLGIFNYNKDKTNVFYPYINVISAKEGKLSYFTKEESNDKKFKTEKYETYDEAVAILEKKAKASESK